jgi:hypothetical protein
MNEEVALHFPTAYYFFVAPSKRQFADDLCNGLEMLMQNGQSDKIFLKQHQASITKARLTQRAVPKLQNPYLNPANMRLQSAELWFKP